MNDRIRRAKLKSAIKRAFKEYGLKAEPTASVTDALETLYNQFLPITEGVDDVLTALEQATQSANLVVEAVNTYNGGITQEETPIDLSAVPTGLEELVKSAKKFVGELELFVKEIDPNNQDFA